MIRTADPKEMVMVVSVTPNESHDLIALIAADDQRFVHPLAHVAIEHMADSACPWCNKTPLSLSLDHTITKPG